MNAREKGRFVGYVLKSAARDVRRRRFRGIAKRSVQRARFAVMFEQLPDQTQKMILGVTRAGLYLAAALGGIR
jgi:adenine/guanine phosphoribosyltransferase-like PRPP-binding protein